MRKLTYCDAINEALHQEMERDSSVVLYGIGATDHKELFGSVRGILQRFGSERIFDMPLAEDSMMGFGIGAAVGGVRPVYTHIRVDFLLLAMNQLINMASTYHYMTNIPVPLTIRAIIGRGWGQGMQHSKSLQSLFAHIPGLKVVMPTTPYDAKGMLISAIRDPNPVIVLEHRWLYWADADVPEEEYTVPLDEASVVRNGDKITIVSTSWMTVEAIRAADIMKTNHGVDVEIIDARCISPSSKVMHTIIESVNKTRSCIVADNDWIHCGFASEISANIYDALLPRLDQPIRRIGFAFTPCPTVRKLENLFYSNAKKLVWMMEDMFSLEHKEVDESTLYSHEHKFKGPF